MSDKPKERVCGNCGHFIEGGEPPPKPYKWNCSNGRPTPEAARRGPCPHWYLKKLTDNDY